MRIIKAGIITVVIAALAACGGGEGRESDFERYGGTVDRTCSGTRAITKNELEGSTMPDKTIALTFDDGPSESTVALSQYLKTQKIAATFFINGVYVTKARESILTQQIADGHLLGNHTHTHKALTTLAAADVVTEVANTDQILGTRVAPEKLYFRPPFGDWNAAVVTALSTSAMNKYQGPVGWDIGDKLSANGAADWDCWDDQNGTRTVEQCGDLYLKEIKTKKHGVVLMHDGPPDGNGAKTLAMVKYLVPLLKQEGFAFKRIDEVKLHLPSPDDNKPPTGGGESGKPSTTSMPATVEEAPPPPPPPPSPPATDPCAGH